MISLTLGLLFSLTVGHDRGVETAPSVDPIGPVGDFECSAGMGELAKALAAAQGEIENAAATAENPHFRSKYADLAAIVDAVRGPLARHAIARHQALFSYDDLVGVRTSLIHSSGQWLASTVWCKSPGTPQGMGSVVTYLRRYSLAAAVGIAQDDDDAEAAMVREPVGKKTAAKLDGKVQARIKILQGELGIGDDEWREKLRALYDGASSSAQLTAEQAQDLIGRLEARKVAAARAQGAKVTPMSPESE